MKKSQKAILIAVLACLVVMAAYSVTYLKNEKMINHVAEDVIKKSDFKGLGIVFPYVFHYNRGNLYYMSGDYGGAYLEYEKAIKSWIPKGQECDIRINMALSMLKMLPPIEEIRPNEIDSALEMLHQASDILCEKGCADAEDNNGWHDYDAQRLEREILDYIRQLEEKKQEQNKQNEKQDPQDNNQNNNNNNNNQDNNGKDNNDNNNNSDSNSGNDDQNGSSPDDSKNNDQNNQGETPKPEESDPTKELQDRLKDSQRRGEEERFRSLDNIERSNNYDYDYYGGEFW